MYLIPFDTFMYYAGSYTSEIKDTQSPIRLLFLNERGAYKTSRYIRRMRKYYVDSSCYDVIKLINLIEE